jgi:prevent-host-death family protein
MHVNMLEAKSQLSKLVKAAIAGEDVVIASHGQPQVRLVPCTAAPGLRQWGGHGPVIPSISIRPSAKRQTRRPSNSLA